MKKSIFWVVGPLVGICLGATGTSARALVVDLSPPKMIGEIFGLYGLAGRFASIIGPLIWGLTVWAFSFLGILKYRLAVFVLWLFLGVAYFFFRQLPDKKYVPSE
jgi:UMF1 family MFS transporter